jgi:PAS domain S-box-containing protein
MSLLRNLIAEKVEFFSRILDTTHDVIWAMDINGKFIYASPSVEKLRGFTVEEVLQEEAFAAIHADDQKLVRRIFNTGVELIEKGVTRIPPGKVRLRQLCKDGTTVWTEVFADYVFNEDREFLFVLGLSRNIDDLVKAEQQIKELKKKS